MKYSFKFLCTAILTLTVLNLNSVFSQDLLVAPNGPITLGLGTIEDMAFSPDGKYIATASSRGITLWNAQTFNLIKTLYSSTEQLYFRKILGNFQSYSYYHGCGDSSTSYKSFDGTSYNWSRTIPARNPKEDQLCIQFSLDGDFITNGIEVWSINDGTVTDTFDDADNWPTIPTSKYYSYSVESDYNSDDYTSVYTLKIQTVEGDSVATIESQVAPKFASSYPMSVHFSPDGKTLGVLWNTPGGKADYLPLDTSAVLYDLTKDGSSLGTLGHHFDWITSVTFSPNNNVVATTKWQAIDLWNVDTGKHLHTLDIPMTLVRKVSFSADGSLIATTIRKGPFLIWQVDTGELIFSSEGSDIKANDVVLHPNGKSVAFIGYPTSSQQSEAALYILEISEGHPQLLQKESLYGDVKFSPDGSKLVIQAFDKCTVWNAEKRLLMYEVDDCWDKFIFSPNSKFLVSWESDPDYIYEDYNSQHIAGATLYDLEEGHLLSHIPHDININSLDFSLEGNQLATVGFDGLLLMSTESQVFIEKLSNFSARFPSINQAAFTLENSIVTFHINGDIFLWENPVPYDPYLGWLKGALIPSKHQKNFFDLTTSPDKRTIAARNTDGTVTLFPIGYPNDFK